MARPIPLELPLQDPVALREQEAHRQYFQENHSIWWFDNRSLLGFVLLALTSLLLPSVYLYLVWRGIWLFAVRGDVGL